MIQLIQMKFDSNKNKTFKAFNVFIVFIKHFIISKEMLRKIGYIECHSITLVSKHQSVLLYLMDHFTISDIEQLSGIKAHTLRVWEQRYRIFTPKRKDSQHRYYDNEDLKYILRIANLNQKGYKISKIARMSSEEIRSLTIELAQTESMYEQFIAQMLEATLALDEIKLKKAFDTVTLYAETEEIVMHLLYPFMSRLGMNWMADVVRPVHEHFASNFVAGKILQATHALESASNGPGVILFTPEGEYHEIPTLFIQYLLKKNGHRVAYFGANTSLEAITEYLRLKDADRIHFHVITHLGNTSLNDYTQNLLESFPGKKIIASGPHALQITLKHPNLNIIRSMDALLALCRQPAVL